MKGRTEKSSWRLFCAVALPLEVRARVAAHAVGLRQSHADVRAGWEREDKLHLTLKFIGEVAPERAAALQRAAERATSGVDACEVTLEGAGVFPARGPARVLWLGVRDGAGCLKLLQQRLEEECAAEGFTREARPFHPHLTLARLRTPGRDVQALAESHLAAPFPPVPFCVHELFVVKSVLGPGGSRHTLLSRHSLHGARAANEH